jgi:hypothetical protein
VKRRIIIATAILVAAAAALSGTGITHAAASPGALGVQLSDLRPGYTVNDDERAPQVVAFSMTLASNGASTCRGCVAGEFRRYLRVVGMVPTTVGSGVLHFDNRADAQRSFWQAAGAWRNDYSTNGPAWLLPHAPGVTREFAYWYSGGYGVWAAEVIVQQGTYVATIRIVTGDKATTYWSAVGLAKTVVHRIQTQG